VDTFPIGNAMETSFLPGRGMEIILRRLQEQSRQLAHLSAPMSKQLESAQHNVLTGGTILLVLIIVSCTGQDYGVLQPTPENLCKCLPVEPDIADYRHLGKHVPIPDVPIQEATGETIFGWAQDPVIPRMRHAPGGSLGVFHIATAFLQNASANSVDCDVVTEIS